MFQNSLEELCYFAVKLARHNIAWRAYLEDMSDIYCGRKRAKPCL